MLQRSGHVSCEPARGKNRFSETWKRLCVSRFISNGNITRPCGTHCPSYLFLEARALFRFLPYSSLNRSYRSVQTARANIALVTQLLTNIESWRCLSVWKPALRCCCYCRLCICGRHMLANRAKTHNGQTLQTQDWCQNKNIQTDKTYATEKRCTRTLLQPQKRSRRENLQSNKTKAKEKCCKSQKHTKP